MGILKEIVIGAAGLTIGAGLELYLSGNVNNTLETQAQVQQLIESYNITVPLISWAVLRFLIFISGSKNITGDTSSKQEYESHAGGVARLKGYADQQRARDEHDERGY